MHCDQYSSGLSKVHLNVYSKYIIFDVTTLANYQLSILINHIVANCICQNIFTL